MPRYEYYNTGDDGSDWIRDVYWDAQTFTVGADGHTVTSIKLLLYREGSPGTVTVSIRATDVDGHPTGADLTVGTIDGNTIGPTTAAWYEIALTEYMLSANTKYAIVVRLLIGDSLHTVAWRHDGTSPTYADGNNEYSSDSGDTWTSNTAKDRMFEVWGPGPWAHL